MVFVSCDINGYSSNSYRSKRTTTEMKTMDITKQITDEFCECFSDKNECKGIMSRIIGTGELPEGVDPNDARVKQIIIWCEENTTK